MINPQWLELPIPRINSYGPKDFSSHSSSNVISLLAHVNVTAFLTCLLNVAVINCFSKNNKFSFLKFKKKSA